jgi:hypothetical protein
MPDLSPENKKLVFIILWNSREREREREKSDSSLRIKYVQ